MGWVYLSPHLDDVALSCGGLVWEQGQAGERVEIWTVCAGDPPEGELSPFAASLHERWQTGREATGQRREEDLLSASQLEAQARHFSTPDCIYRRLEDGQAPYASEEAIFGEVHPGEAGLIQQLARELEEALSSGWPEGAQPALVCPLGLGHHVDHQLVRAAAERLSRPLWYYADYPYVAEHPQELEQMTGQGWQATTFPVSEAGFEAWVRAVEAHASQISTFWSSREELREALKAYLEAMGGVRLWKVHP